MDDRAFAEQMGQAGVGVGVLARDRISVACFSAWRVLFHCSGPAEAEARPSTVGLRLATHRIQKPAVVVVLESDCARMIYIVKREQNNLQDNQ